ncbi:hypothetical protein V5P93_001424 [Actinokineospora auranticolor]|uniref:Uncharacterized protein n=1 Tax=Actinokineospora auranticolor TaxID=155976 RepID=A0A2S6GUZ8_9PSEU|nr:hypothetical protein [Actinokineospora auranticolor]PPK69048.1 hypothetical protein CLV40_104298 [Actinokineospora auranticolor]
MASLLALIAAHDEVARVLAWPGGFELGRADHLEDVHLAGGAALEPIAGDQSGGTFFFCGEGGEERPVLYADSEGGAALLATGLPELLRLLLVVPWWGDCPAFTAEEHEEARGWYLEDEPDLLPQRERAAAVLGLELPDGATALARLREVATSAGPDFALVLTSDNEPYRQLIPKG